jgi:hypothetical protein
MEENFLSVFLFKFIKFLAIEDLNCSFATFWIWLMIHYIHLPLQFDWKTASSLICGTQAESKRIRVEL